MVGCSLLPLGSRWRNRRDWHARLHGHGGWTGWRSSTVRWLFLLRYSRRHRRWNRARLQNRRGCLRCRFARRSYTWSRYCGRLTRLHGAVRRTTCSSCLCRLSFRRLLLLLLFDFSDSHVERFFLPHKLNTEIVSLNREIFWVIRIDYCTGSASARNSSGGRHRAAECAKPAWSARPANSHSSTANGPSHWLRIVRISNPPRLPRRAKRQNG